MIEGTKTFTVTLGSYIPCSGERVTLTLPNGEIREAVITGPRVWSKDEKNGNDVLTYPVRGLTPAKVRA